MTEADSTDLRSGSPLHDALLALLPLVGVWVGAGTGIAPADQSQFRYRQRVSFGHDGRPFLAYDSRAWLVDDAGELVRPAWRESGFWRPAGEDAFEVVLADNTGQALVFAGDAFRDLRWDLVTTSAVPTPTAKVVGGEKRLYAIHEDALVYATELAPGDRPFAPHLNAALHRSA